VQAEDFCSGDFGQGCCEGGGFKAAVDGVAGLGVATLKVEQVAGLKAHAGPAQPDAGRGERTQASGQRRGQDRVGV
jgi:hypothetical protein